MQITQTKLGCELRFGPQNMSQHLLSWLSSRWSCW